MFVRLKIEINTIYTQKMEARKRNYNQQSGGDLINCSHQQRQQMEVWIVVQNQVREEKRSREIESQLEFYLNHSDLVTVNRTNK